MSEAMAANGESILRETFPHIDDQVHDYVVSMLDAETSDFESAGDIFEEVGDMLLGLDSDKTEDDIMKLCDRLYKVMRDCRTKSVTQNGHAGPVKILDAPVQMGALGSVSDRGETLNSIWIAREKSVTQVDQRKLGKAEAKLKIKQEKRSQQDSSTPFRNIEDYEDNASASQQSNRKETKLDASGSNKSYDIKIENFDVAYGNKCLIKGADLVMAYGRRYGLVGRNGIGKTTLLRMIAKGQLKIPSHIRVLHVEQEVEGGDTLAVQSVLECDVKRQGLLAEEKDISAKLQESGDNALSARLAEVYHELEAIEADKAPAKAAVILAGLGFTPQMQKMSTKEFSGGWRMRLALARALFSKPDLLLLDEPTNMLDMKAIIWLENYLQTWDSTLLVVSHDREFLNTVVTDVLYLFSKRIELYRGDYERFVKTRTERLLNQQKEYDAQKQYREHVQVFIDKFRFNAKRASLVQSKLKLLEKLPELQPVEREPEVILKFNDTEKLSPPVLQLDELSFHYEAERPIFKNICVNVDADSRICVVGENGAGKTTLLKIVLGELNPTSGLRHTHRNLKMGYFSQHHIDQLDMNLCSVEVLQARFPGKNAEYYRQQLGGFGISGELGLRPVASLSGGQKSRVAFAQLNMSNPNLFVLDEPTNHLDMETIEALGKSLEKFKGGVILVSHDERLIRMICKELWVCGDGKVQRLDGGIDEYKKIVQDELAAQN